MARRVVPGADEPDISLNQLLQTRGDPNAPGLSDYLRQKLWTNSQMGMPGPGIIAGRPVGSAANALAQYAQEATAGGTPTAGTVAGLKGMADELRPAAAGAIQKFRQQYVAPGREGMGDVLRMLETSQPGQDWANMARAAAKEKAAFGRSTPFGSDIPAAPVGEPMPAAPQTSPMEPGFDPRQQILDMATAPMPGQDQDAFIKALRAFSPQQPSNVIPFPGKKGK